MENVEFLKQTIESLKMPIPSQWRVQSYGKTKAYAIVMSYIDARDCMDLLDQYAIYGWNREHYTIDGKIYCRVSINMPDGSVQSRSDCGTESSSEKEKGQSSDSFKRACVNFGIGRFLYERPIVYVKTDVVKNGSNYPKFITEDGQPISDLNAYCNALHPSDKRPLITVRMLNQAIDKIKGGDLEVKDKTIKAFQMSEYQKSVLQYEQENFIKSQEKEAA